MMVKKMKIQFYSISNCRLLSALGYVGTAIQHMLDPLSPHVFISFTSAFKFYYSVNCFYPKISHVFTSIFPLPSGPCWCVIVDPRDYTCNHSFLNTVDRGQKQQQIRLFLGMRLCLHFFVLVNVPAMCLLFILATTCSHFQFEYVFKMMIYKDKKNTPERGGKKEP